MPDSDIGPESIAMSTLNMNYRPKNIMKPFFEPLQVMDILKETSAVHFRVEKNTRTVTATQAFAEFLYDWFGDPRQRLSLSVMQGIQWPSFLSILDCVP